MGINQGIKDFAFSILDRSKFRGFHLLRDLRFYAKEFNLKTDVMFDVGANIGQTSTALRKYFPDTIIHAFEPIDSTFEVLKQNIGDSQKTIPNNFALGSEAREATIILSDMSCINSLLREIKPDSELSPQQNTQVVKVITGDSYCHERNIDDFFLLKTDTEGFDLDVVKGFGEIIKEGKIKFILSEVTFDRNCQAQTHFSVIDEYLSSHGYRVSGFYDLSHQGGIFAELYYCNCLWSWLPR